LGGRKQIGMIARAAFVPIPERLPFCSVRSRTKNLALGGENEIRADRKFKVGESRFKQIDRSSGIDGPNRAVRLQIANQLQTFHVQNRLAHARNHRPIEIETEKFDPFRIQALNLGIDLGNATGTLEGTPRCALSSYIPNNEIGL
jgi:hypothetical protein